MAMRIRARTGIALAVSVDLTLSVRLTHQQSYRPLAGSAEARESSNQTALSREACLAGT